MSKMDKQCVPSTLNWMDASAAIHPEQCGCHHLTEVRQRALKGLRSKLVNGILSPKVLAQDESLVSKLLYGMRNDCPIEEKCATLDILLYILEYPEVRIKCSKSGLESALLSLQKSVPELYAITEKALSLLLSCPLQSQNEPIQEFVEGEHASNSPPTVVWSLAGNENSQQFTLDVPKQSHSACWRQEEPGNVPLHSENEMRFKLRAEWRETNRDHADKNLEGVFSASGPLQTIHLNASDEQHLFQLGIRLRFGEDPRVILPALFHLCESDVLDFPPEAFIQQRALMEGILSTLKANIGVSSLAQTSLRFLGKLVSSLRSALDQSLCTDLHTHCQPAHLRNLDSSLYNTYIWRSYPPPPAVKTDNQSVLGALGCIEDEKKGLDVGTFVCWLASHVFPLLGNEGLFVYAVPLAEEMVRLLAHPGCTNCSSVHPQVTKLLGILSETIITFTARATAQYNLQNEDDHEVDRINQPQVMDFSSFVLSSLSLRLVKILEDCGCPQFIPQSLLKVVAELAADEFICAMLPSLRPFILPHLPHVAPHVAAILNKGAAVQGSIHHASTVISQTKGLFDESVSLKHWIKAVHGGLAGIKWLSNDKFLKASVCGLVLCQLKENISDEMREELESLAINLLSDHGPRISSETCKILVSMVENGENHVVSTGATKLLASKKVLQNLLTVQLSKEHVQDLVVNVIDALLKTRNSQCILELGEWDWLLHCYESNPVVNGVAGDFLAKHKDLLDATNASTLAKLRHSVRKLYHCDAKNREAGSHELWEQIEKDGACLQPLQYEGDPFGGFLDHLDETLRDAAFPLAAPFSGKDVENLIGVIMNASLDASLRKSAIEHLAVIARQSDLLDIIAVPDLLLVILKEVCCGLSEGSGPGIGLSLVLASLGALWDICSRSKKARQIVEGNADSLFLQLLPAVYHPFVSVRRMICALLSTLVFPSESLGQGGLDHTLMTLINNSFRAPLLVGRHTLLEQTPKGQRSEERLTEEDRLLRRLLNHQQILSMSSPYQVFQALNDGHEIDGETKSTLCNVYLHFELSQSFTSDLDKADLAENIQKLRRWFLWSSGIPECHKIPAEVESIMSAVDTALSIAEDEALESDDDYRIYVEVLEFIGEFALKSMNKDAAHCLLKKLQKLVVPILTADNAGSAIPNLPVAQASFNSSALVSSTHQYWVLHLTGTFMNTIRILLKCYRESARSESEIWEALYDIGLEDLVDIISTGFVLKQGCDYGCRWKGMAVLQELGNLVVDAALWNGISQHSFRMDGNSAPILAHPMAPIVRMILMSNAKSHADGHLHHKGLLREALQFLDNLMFGLQHHEWAHAWEQVAGVTWISRLSRDTEANIRTAALSILTHVASDNTGISLSILLKGWPEALNRTLDCACNLEECSKVRSTAIGVLCQVMATLQELENNESPLLGECQPLQAFFLSFPQEDGFWEMVTSLVCNMESPMVLVLASLGVLLQAILFPFPLRERLIANKKLVDVLMLRIDEQYSSGRHSHTSSGSVASASMIWESVFLLSNAVNAKTDTIRNCRHQILGCAMHGLLHLMDCLMTEPRTIQEEASLQESIGNTALGADRIAKVICDEDGHRGVLKSLIEVLGVRDEGYSLYSTICRTISRVREDAKCHLCSLLATLVASQELYDSLSARQESTTGQAMFMSLKEVFESAPKGSYSGHTALTALRNMLAYCGGVKVAAVQVGYHAEIIEKCKACISQARSSLASTGSHAGKGMGRRRGGIAKGRVKKSTAQKPVPSVSKEVESQLLEGLNLIRHLIAQYMEGKIALLSCGIVRMLLESWDILSMSVVCKHEALKLLGNMCCNCVEATGETSKSGGPLGSLLSILLNQLGHLEGQSSCADSLVILDLMNVYSASMEGCNALVRAGFLEVNRGVMRRAIAAKDVVQLHAGIQVLENIAGYPDGQIHMMKPSNINDLLELIIYGMKEDQTKSSATMVLRNLSFIPNFSHYLLAQSHCLHHLLELTQCSSHGSSITIASNTASALWALMSQGEKIKAALRTVPEWDSILNCAIEMARSIHNEGESCKKQLFLLENLTSVVDVMEPFTDGDLLRL